MKANPYSGKLENAKRLFNSGQTRSIENRLSSLRRLADTLKSKENEILNALELDLGKPRVEAFLSELYFLHTEINFICKHLKSWLKPKKVKNPVYFLPAKSWTEFQPFGVALIFSPWNYPIQLALSPIIAAIAAGNTVLLKPSEVTSHCEQVLLDIVAQCFSDDWVQCILGGPDVSKDLLELDVDFVFFTGSTDIGKKVDLALAGRLIPKVMELGGKCPCIVNDTKSLTHTASRILTGKFFNAGQTCFGVDFVAVQDSLHDSLVDELQQQLTARFPNGNLDDLASTPSPLHAERVIQLRSKQAIVIGQDKGSKVAPTLQCIDLESPLLEQEVFGPLLPIIRYKDQAELNNILAKLHAPLALYLFSYDQAFIEHLSQTFPSGSVCINDTMKQNSNLNSPFGGVGMSGMGRYRGKWGIEQFSYRKSVMKRYLTKDPFEITQPYESAFEKMKKLLRW